MKINKTQFTDLEATQIRCLLNEKACADRNRQKRIRDKIRKIGFYISDFNSSIPEFKSSHFDSLIVSGTISVDKTSNTSKSPKAVSVSPANSLRQQNDESYIIDLCDEVLQRTAMRQHRFAFLVGDKGHPLPVDAYYKDLSIVIEYRERQHTEDVPFFNRRATVSGVPRGEQRKIYDQRRRDDLPKHGISLIGISVDEFSHNSAKRLDRSPSNDRVVVAARLARWTA